MLHQENYGVRAIFRVKEFPFRGAGSPNRDGRRITGLGIVHFPHEGGKHMAGRKIEIVVCPVQVGGHARDEIRSVLPSVGLAHLQARDLGNRVGLVRRFERAGEQFRFGDRLSGGFRIDAGRTDEHQLFDADLKRRVNDVRFDHQVFIDEVRRIGIVRQDAADLGGRYENQIRLLSPKP